MADEPILKLSDLENLAAPLPPLTTVLFHGFAFTRSSLPSHATGRRPQNEPPEPRYRATGLSLWLKQLEEWEDQEGVVPEVILVPFFTLAREHFAFAEELRIVTEAYHDEDLTDCSFSKEMVSQFAAASS